MAPTGLDQRIDAIDAASLLPILRRALNRSTLTLTHWTAEPLRAVKGGIGGSRLYRVSGTVEDGDETIAWSLILKVLIEPAGNDKREVDFYRSNVAQGFPPGLRPAHCYTISEHVDETGKTEYWLWLEDLAPHAGVHWTVDDHHRAAQLVGQFQGAFVVDHALPSAPWLDSSGVRGYLAHVAPWVAQLQQQQHHPVVRLLYPPAAAASFLQCWQNRETYLATLARLPQTLCHGDAQCSNLFLQSDAAGKREAVAVDWGGIGIQALGYDINQMLVFSLATMEVDADQAPALDQAIFDGYLQGLQAAGWRGNPQVVRLGYTTTAFRSRSALVYRSMSVILGDDQNLLRNLEQIWHAKGLSMEEANDNLRRVDAYFSTLLDEAGELRDRL